MHVGILNMYPYKLGPYLPRALESIGCTYTIVDFDENHSETIRRSRHTRWILTGSSDDVMKKTTPQLDLSLLKIENKRFLAICYSMESILLQLGCHLIKRKNNVREYFDLDLGGTTIKAFRNHYTYVVPDSMKRGMRLLATYKGNAMNVNYKNMTMVQWHPEKTADGIQFLAEWMK